MKKVLILGAGMVVNPIVRYLLDKGFIVTVATRTKSKADEMIAGHKNGRSVAWTVEQESELDALIADHDLTVSLLPYRLAVPFSQLERWGFPILLVLLFTGILGMIIWPFISLFKHLILILFQLI